MLDRRLLIVTGKGGVGRSAVASAIARARAERGERVLALAIDRGSGLAAHLGRVRLDHEPHEVVPRLHAAVVDPASALEEYVRLQIPAPVGLASRVFGVLALTVPGVRDIVLIGKVWYEAIQDAWDTVVVDAAPAGQIQSILRSPSTIAELVPKGTVHDQARRMAETLADADTTELVVVATPEELALTEATEVLVAADDAGVSPTRSVIVNRVLPAAPFTVPPSENGARRAAAGLHLDIQQAQTERMATIESDLRLPLHLGSHRPSDISLLLASRIEAA